MWSNVVFVYRLNIVVNTKTNSIQLVVYVFHMNEVWHHSSSINTSNACAHYHSHAYKGTISSQFGAQRSGNGMAHTFSLSFDTMRFVCGRSLLTYTRIFHWQRMNDANDRIPALEWAEWYDSHVCECWYFQSNPHSTTTPIKSICVLVVFSFFVLYIRFVVVGVCEWRNSRKKEGTNEIKRKKEKYESNGIRIVYAVNQLCAVLIK